MAGMTYLNVSLEELQIELEHLIVKHQGIINRIEEKCKINFNFEVNGLNIYKPYDTMACAGRDNEELEVFFLLHHIQPYLNGIVTTRYERLKRKAMTVFLEFILLHELKHLDQFCRGMTMEEYKEIHSYKDNPYEIEANSFAMNEIEEDSKSNGDLIKFLLGNNINNKNEDEWIQKIN
ncbi:hypothetical protein [Lysinibacillus boronitolerans]|uniref:hypothetical protein n=1 Tax=Lysinibacillus boronitolerans TaxID=309788 RepID=UPI0028966E4C|nr:hypothetical protein [Lysinibacillus boronitolerans]